MKLFDRITRKDEVEKLGQLVEAQKATLAETREVLAVTETQVRHYRAELKEAEVWKELSGDSSDRELTDQDRDKLRKASNKAYYQAPEGRAIIKNLTNYIIGQGVHWTAQDENPIIQKFIDDFCEADGVKFSKRQFSIVSRTLREGELFIHLITNSNGVTYALRFYPPAEITEIEKEPGDAELVKSYQRVYTDQNGKAQKGPIPADQVHHIRLDVDEDVDRGRPLMEPVLKRITQYNNWLRDRIITNEAKSSTFLEKIVEGSPSRVATVAASLPGATKGNFTDDEYSVQKPRAGTVAVHSKSIEYKWVAPNINADDCKEDGRQIRLSIAAGVGLPEFILTSDASNANFASTMIAESPFVKGIEAYQKFFEEEFKLLFAKVIKKGVAGGSLPQTSTETVMKEAAFKKCLILKAMKEAAVNAAQADQIGNQMAGIVQDQTQYEEREIPTKTAVDFQWPSIVSRNIFEETQAIDMHYQNGWVSKQTAQMKFGYDPDEEARKIEKEKEEEVTGAAAYRKIKTGTEGDQAALDAQKRKELEDQGGE